MFMAAAALGALVGAAPVTAAFAGPSGCSHQTTHFNQHSGGELHAIGAGDCSSANYYRVLKLEIKQDISWQPDPVALSASDAGWQYYYTAAALGCDNGPRSGRYYGRTFFKDYTDYSDTSHIWFENVC
jgi:hypothetical protein